MKIAIYGNYISPDFKPYITELFDRLEAEKVEISIFKPFYDFLIEKAEFAPIVCTTFNNAAQSPDDIDFLISIGGDGTFLGSMLYLKSSKIPVIGLNSGRLGYLANIGYNEIQKAFDAIFANDYEIEQRSLLRIESEIQLFEGFNFALNEVSVQKVGSSLLAIDTWINDEFVNTYWTDGLIIATPTGSTAYSLSVGGPVVVPGSNNFIIAPIASHNLTVRPLVIPDNVNIKLVVKPRGDKFLVAADNRTQLMDLKHNELNIRKTKFILKMLKLPFNNYYSTLRNKLMWGADKRNYNVF
jgi:NAD+ kinase